MNKKLLISALLPSLMLAACSNDDNDDNGTETQTGTIMQFAATSGDIAVNCDNKLTGLGEGVEADLQSLAFYIHDVQLETDTNQIVDVKLATNDWQQENVALLDFTNRLDDCASADAKPTNSNVTGSYELPEGAEVTGVRFKVGVPFELNHNDPAEADKPLNRADMFWNWQGGYKFLKADVAVNGSAIARWNIHMGSTGCDGDPVSGGTTSCVNPNRTQVELGSFTPGDTVRFDYQTLVAEATMATNTPDTPPGCMSKPGDPECVSIFNKMGLEYGDSGAAPAQSVFTVVTAE
ncbi:Uncharacterised protein [BD1-7 clade bacterium]|uniref:Copper-binding protein MbnP-like domain-containing protein n=1 Tax=BD1-7 clade bacterium TaxID=2029982 RepID=A0A5S9PP29_9GAMM|nr:Uncharacterised protein [BD1-7 clade bacterium]CAA0105742.1 Uncharacterised protein [BD1-7 clade bacterium]